MKLVFLGTSSAIIYYMRYHRIIKLTYDKEQDTFKHLLLIAPSAVLAMLTTHNYTIVEVSIHSAPCSKNNPQLIQPTVSHLELYVLSPDAHWLLTMLEHHSSCQCLMDRPYSCS